MCKGSTKFGVEDVDGTTPNMESSDVVVSRRTSLTEDCERRELGIFAGQVVPNIDSMVKGK